MKIMRAANGPPEQAVTPMIPEETVTGNPPPWELLEAGRYLPRRIRGSYRGRELG